MSKKIIFTIISYNYLAYASTLYNSLKTKNPDIKFIIGLVDTLPKKGLNEDFEIIPMSKLNIKNQNELAFKYNVTCLNTAVKPLYFQYIFKKYNPESVIYLDPDIFVFGSLETLFSKLKEYKVILTPHTLKPFPEDGCIPDEIRIMQVGTYNLGFVGMQNCDETYEFCSWWWNKLEKYTYDGDFICDDSVIFSCVSDDFFRVKEIKNIVI